MFSDNKKLVSDDILYFVEHKKTDPDFEQIIGRYVKITLLGSKDLRLYNWYKSLRNRNHLFRTDNWCAKIMYNNEYACRIAVEDIEYNTNSNIASLSFFVSDPSLPFRGSAKIAHQKMINDVNCIHPKIETDIDESSIYCLTIFVK